MVCLQFHLSPFLTNTISVYAGKIGINYVFNNGKILSYQDNYSKLGDLPFAVYYDFQATTGSVTFLMQRRM